MRIQVRLTIAPLVLLVLAACGTSGAAGPSDVSEAAEVEVEVDMFSGVPNPAWTVHGTEAAALIELINALPEDGEIDISAELNLGFRGFVLRGVDLPGDADQVRVLDTRVVVLRDHTAGTLRTDPDREIYTMLRTMSAEHLEDDVIPLIPLDGLKGS